MNNPQSTSNVHFRANLEEYQRCPCSGLISTATGRCHTCGQLPHKASSEAWLDTVVGTMIQEQDANEAAMESRGT